MARVITILEVSQKQAYIFESNRLRDNITNSAVIAHVLSPEYINTILSGTGYTDDDNMVYAGGGHTILTFSHEQAENIVGMNSAMEMARMCTKKLTEQIYRDFDGLTVFAKTIPYDEALSVDDNLKALTAALESKKSIRKAAFKKGSFGLERTDSTTLKPMLSAESSQESEEKAAVREAELRDSLPGDITGEGYQAAIQFDKLGGTKNSSNFIAVVHIDGNGMGKRVENLYENTGINKSDFDEARKILREFSECIDRDYKDAYKDMLRAVSTELRDNKDIQKVLSIKADRNGQKYFPVRKVIAAGDDICFVAEGRIGIECAVKFLEALGKKTNTIDQLGYTACAGVAIVHQKYPFYRAYDLAEMLCSNAKSFNATVHEADNGQCLSSIDWHIEYGELDDSVEEVRDNYLAYDGTRLNLRPYIVQGADGLNNDIRFYHSYAEFKKRFNKIIKGKQTLSVGKMKELRKALRYGEDETAFYLTSNIMTEVFPVENEFIKDFDGERCSTSFDLVELMDTYIPFQN